MGIDSEYMCELVTVRSVEKHPNADKLEILRLDSVAGPLGYTVVDGIGLRSVGDVVCYLSVDCVVPLGSPHFRFLKERKDCATHVFHRIRAARLRGIYSEGLVIDAPQGFKLGDDVAKHLEVTYHNPDVKNGNNSMAAGTPPSPKKDWRKSVIPEYSLVSLKKVPNAVHEGEPVVVTEKIHGTNFRFGWIKHRGRWHWIVGSHRTFRSDNRSWFARFWSKLTGAKRPQGWYGEDLWMAEADKFKDVCPKGYIFYGEIYGCTPGGRGIQDLTYGHVTPQTRLFDAWTLDGYVNRSKLELLALACGVKCTPILYAGPYRSDVVVGLAEGKSTLDSNTIREGVVIERIDPDNDFRKLKLVGEGYRLRKTDK